MQSKDIICISTHYWDDAWFRKQQFMSRFHAAGCRILYVQPTASIIRRAQGNPLAKNGILFGKTEKIDDKLFLYYPPWTLPKPANPLSASIDYKWQSLQIARAAKSIGMVNPVLWVYRPQYSVGIKYIPHSKLVLDLVDDLSAYNKSESAQKFLIKCIQHLVNKSDLFVTTSAVLLEKYGGNAQQHVVVPNGFDSNIFQLTEYAQPEEIKNLKRPIIGFIGTLFGFLDYELIEYCVQQHKDKSFVFIGGTEKSGAEGVARLKKYPNTYFLGRKPKDQIPYFVANFDLCISPFKVDNVSRSVSPLKVYEYLSIGRPVVSAFMEGLSRDEAGPYVTFAKDKESFSECITQELATDSLVEQEKRSAGVSGMSWNKLYAQLAEKCDSVL